MKKKEKEPRKLDDLDGIGPAMLKDFQILGISSVEQLAAEDPQKLYDRLCKKTHSKHDICVLDVFTCAVAQAQDPKLPKAQRQWHWWSRKRKARISSFR